MGKNGEVMLDVEGGQMRPAEVTVTRQTAARSSQWMMVGALLAMALCISAAVYLTVHRKSEVHVEDADDLRLTLRHVSGTKAAIHLEGIFNASYSKFTVEWSDDVDQGFSQGGLKLRNNEIVVSKSGLYFVYSQVSFEVNCHAQQAVHLSHSIRRRSNSIGNDDDDDEEDLYRPLLHSIRTVCEGRPSKPGSSFNAVYVGAVFNLERGDRLKTDTEKRLLPHLQDESGKNYFGVFAL